MHTDQEVLAALLTKLDQDQLAAVLNRVLRVPEAWASLHNPAFLDEVVSANPPAHLTPSHLASLALGGSLHSEMRRGLAEAHAERARQAWDEAAVGVVVQRDLFDTALLAAEFERRYDGDPEGLLERVTDSPSTWRSPIAIAWPNLKQAENLLGSLLNRNLYQFAIQIALANFPAGEAAALLTRNANGSTVQMLQQITRGGESALARSLELAADGGTDKLSQLLIEAVTRQFNGEHNAARSSLKQAWETASETTAQIADFTADQARETGDLVAELEANRRALEILPTPARRARTALSLLSLDRPGEALSLVSGADPSVEERIACGLAQSQSRDTGALLNIAMASIDDSLDEEWFAVLTEGLVGAEDWAAAVEAAQTRVAHHPSSLEAQVSLAHVLLEGGDPEAADEHAAIGLALNPHSEKALKLQAEIRQHELQAEIRQHELQAFEALAAAQIDGGERSEAHHTLTEAVQANPKDPAIRQSLSRYLRAQGKTSEALEVASVAWELDEKSVPTGLEYADLLSELGHVDRALEILRQAALRQPLSWQVGLALAKAYERRGDMSQADRAIRPLPSSAPPEAYFHTARISLKAGTEVRSALQYLELAENGGWSDPSLDYWFGRAFEREKSYEDALARYDRAQNSSDYEIREEAVLGSARAALGLDQISRALAALEQAQEHFPRSARILAAMSDVYLVANLPDKALEVAERAVELEPEETRAWHALGDSLANAGDFRGAVKAIERLSALDPAAAEGWLTLARLASQAQDQRVVRRSVAEALWRGRRNPNILQDVAQFLEQTGNLRTAVSVMKAATRTRPEDAQMLGALAMIQESAEDYQGAYETWQSSIALAPSEPEPLRRSAACAQMLGLGGQSVKLLEKAVAIEPGNPWMRRDLAIAHLEQGQVRQGLLAYAGAVKSAPNDSSLAYEAAEAALCSGDPRYALALLGKTGSALANSGRAQAAMGEAFLLLDKQDQAVSSLSEAVEQGYETTRTFSMLAITAPDRGRAVEYLARARSVPIESAHDAIWRARAEAELFNASEAMEALKAWAADPFAAQEQVRVSLRSRDTLWLFGLSDGVSPLREDALTSHAQSALEDLQKRNLADPALDAWLRIEGTPSDLGEHIDADPLGWIGEAVAVAYIKSDQVEAAREALDQVRLVRSESAWRSVLEGLIHEASGRQEDARAAYRSGGSSSPVACFLLGRAYERSGSLERAATHMGAAVVEAPDQHRWQHKLASVYLEMGDEDSALAHFQEAVARDPENPGYLLSLAGTYAASGHLNQALEGYTAALAYGSESAAAHREAGQVALQLGALDQASAWFERAITLSPADIDSLIGSAKASIARGDRQQANERLDAAIQQAPGDARVLLGVGHVRAESGDHRAAMSAFEQALQAGADPSDVRRGESKVLVEQGKHMQAAEVMQEVLSSAPDDHRLWHELAETLEAGSDLSGADRAISEAVRISPANPEYRLSLGRISRKSGNLDRAIEELRQAEGADPEDSRVPIEAGLVYEDRRDYSRALDSYLKAVEIDPNSLQAHYRAGLLLRTLKAYRKAGEMLKRAAELAPADQGVMHQLAAVRALELVHG
ncbi:MAG: hypothetical protein BMS9Abin28_1751 [Anaerolineae bacterium]|nr:MAG: hypothetical protein BMS9Abin28_1751 [Anaerolineae bacterium]